MSPQDLAKEINKLLGTDAVRMGNDPRFQTRVLRTGVLPIDVALNGGFPRNRTTELFGGFSTLKSYICLRAAAETQAAGGVVALIDTERTFDHDWARFCGVDANNLVLPSVTTGEDAVDVTDVLIRNGVDLILWDSVAATMPQDEARKRLGGKEHIQPGRQAALMSAALRRLTAVNDHTALVFTNQTREKVGQVFGNPETTPGGRSLPFYASHRLAMRKGKKETETIKVWDGVGGWVDVKSINAFRVHATLEKSKLTVPGREYVFLWDAVEKQVDEVGYAISYALEHGWITQSGQSWTYNRTTKRGKEAFKTWVADNRMEELKVRIYASLIGGLEADKSKGGKPKPKLRKRKA